jgi:2-isopropylmalate synthase
MDVFLYDTTLRDGTQRKGLSLSLEDKVRIARLLDAFGVTWIEGGWPGSNPKDAEFFRRIKAHPLQHARVTAFGSTRRAAVRAEDDTNLKALLDAQTPAVALVGKTWPLHVTHVLETTLEENLAMISDSIRWMKKNGREVIFDAEHFFDGYRADPAYATRVVAAAAEAGADWVALCDTNGGSLPTWIRDVVSTVYAAVPVKLGIHTHNDGELAVANALAAVDAGAVQVQGTINGYGERCGNCNLISLVPALQLKVGKTVVAPEKLRQLTELSRTVSEIANLMPDPHAAYVGMSAFAHKGGIHVAAVEKIPASYEHVPPEGVGNQRQIVISELSGRGNVRVRAQELGLQVKGMEASVLAKVKALEAKGFQFEAAEGSFELIVRRSESNYQAPFEILDVVVLSEQRRTPEMIAEAMVKVRVGTDVQQTAAEGTGPVHALDLALRKALLPFYPQLAHVRLADYKVRILDPAEATHASTRVLIEAAHGEDRWGTVGCSQNIIEASAQALADSLELFLLRTQASERRAKTA